MPKLSVAKEQLRQLINTPPGKQSIADRDLENYLSLLIGNFNPPRRRSVSLQTKILNNCPFTAPKYLQEELINMLDAQPNNEDPHNSRTVQLDTVGRVWPCPTLPQELVERVAQAVENHHVSLDGRQIILDGLNSHPSIQRATDAVKLLKNRWQIK